MLFLISMRSCYPFRMTRIFIPCVLAMLACTSCTMQKHAFDPAKKFSPTQLREDLHILRSTLESNHPGLYWYTTKDSLDQFFNAVEFSINDSLTESDFRRKVAWWVSKIHCGHTSTRFSTGYTRYYEKKKLPQFPLHIKIWKDTAVVFSSLLKNDSTIKKGNIILAINDMPITKVIDSMCSLLSTDGFADNFKYQAISFNFPAYYSNTFGVDSQYIVRYLDNNGFEKTHAIKNFRPLPDTGRKADTTTEVISKKQLKKLSLTSLRSIKTDTANRTAVIELNTFSKGKLRRFLRQQFRIIQHDSIQHLIIDLRRNTGGSVNISTRLAQYIADHSFKVADTVAAVNRSLTNKKYIRHWFEYWFSMRFATKKLKDNKYHFRYFERRVAKPKPKYHFDGHVYLLTSGYTFSASTLLVNNLLHQKNVTVLGEETGGGFYGNCAIHIPDIVLPNSRVRVRMPLFRLVLDSNRIKTGRGFFPDIYVGPSVISVRKGGDAKMEETRKLIKGATKN